MIQPLVSNSVGNSFDKLLRVMEDSEYDGVKELTKLGFRSLHSNTGYVLGVVAENVSLNT